MDFVAYKGHRILVVQVGPQFFAHVSSEAGILLALKPQPIGPNRTSALNEAMRAIDQSMS